ncbi:hypothetical protein GQX74_010156 [Glossina fuscipes]|nr:hypothetical protein GQX74_010156 [Glossina fuscipes]
MIGQLGESSEKQSGTLEHAAQICRNHKGTLDTSNEFICNQVLLCFNCLRSEHVANKCSSNSRCKICERTYNTLLHTEITPNGSQQTTSTHVTSYNTYSLVKQNSGLLITAQLWVKSLNGEFYWIKD